MVGKLVESEYRDSSCREYMYGYPHYHRCPERGGGKPSCLERHTMYLNSGLTVWDVQNLPANFQ